MKHALAAALAALALSGCATTWHLSLMPRDSGKLYYGTAEDTGSGEGPIAVTIEDKTYRGTWLQTVSDRSYGWVTGGYGYGRRGGWGVGGSVSVDNPMGGEVKALLNAPDGSGLRCDFHGSRGLAGGQCRDDRGREYDVQVRSGPPAPR